MKEDKWLEFKEKVLLKPSKTKKYMVLSKCTNFILGEIKWYPPWRHYCFFPDSEFTTVYSDRCLLSISEFITKLNTEHKK